MDQALHHLSEVSVSVELETEDMTLNIGPQHPSTHGVLRLIAKIDGDNSDLYRLDVSLSYLFSQSENYRLSVSYANGRTDDTLEQTEYWKTQFGVRF